jgi:hypothetical protein
MRPCAEMGDGAHAAEASSPHDQRGAGQLNTNWAADVRSCDRGHRHKLMFADMLSEGIAEQFPGKVARSE